MANARPTGVTILAILALIGGIFGVLFGILGLAGGALLGGIAASTTGAAAAASIGFLVIIAGLLGLIGGVIYIVFFYGAWTAKAYGWALGIIGALWSLVTIVVGAIGSGDIMGSLLNVSTLISVLIAAVILYYLNTPAVKTYFGRA